MTDFVILRLFNVVISRKI